MAMQGVGIQTEHRTYCRICVAACGLLVTVEGDQVVGIKGDRAHPDSAGYTCPKGRALGPHHHDPNRLDEPLVRGTATTWDACLGDLSNRIRQLIDTRG